MENAPSVTERFTGRADDYARHRPGYPGEVIDFLRERGALAARASVADIGSGTGILTRMLLSEGALVFAVEPNAQMRERAEQALGGEPRFVSLAGSAEETGLPEASVDLVTVAQAFHWFDRERARAEFLRILKPRGRVAILWNNRRSDDSDFARAYEALLQEFGTDYREVGHRWVESYDVAPFFRGPFEERAFPYLQRLDAEGIRGRLLSSSYVPAPGAPRHREMLDALAAIFDRHAEQGFVNLAYETHLFLGRPADAGR